MAFQGIEPVPSQRTVSPVNHSQETSLSLHPSIKGRSCPCEILTNLAQFGYRHFMETRKGAFALPLPWNHPIEQEPSCPLHPCTTLRDLDVDIFFDAETRS